MTPTGPPAGPASGPPDGPATGPPTGPASGTPTGHPHRHAARYPLRNADAREARRLALLQELNDPISVRWFEALGVGEGWRCAELGAGGGSLVAWLADRVGQGSVTAVDRDTTQLAELASRPNVEVLEGDLCTMTLPAGAFDLVHSRSVLMHLDDPDHALAQSAAALAPDGIVFLEETDGVPCEAVDGLPDAWVRVMVPMARRWRFARTVATRLEALGLLDVREDVREDPVRGGTALAEFWRYTIGSVADMVERGARDPGASGPAFDLEDLRAVQALLDDPGFEAPLTRRHRITARKPG